MKRLVRSFPLFVFPIVLLLLVFISGCGNSLSRSSAEDLIQEKGETILGEPIGANVSLHLTMYDVVANDDEINRRIPLDHSPLPKGKYLEAKFVEILQKAGVLTLISLKNTITHHHLEPERNCLVLHYGCAPNEDVKKFDKYGYIYETAGLVMARPQLSRITGITQIEKSAQVETEIKWVPTKMYTQVKTLAAQLEAQEGVAPDGSTDKKWLDGLKAAISEVDRRLTSITTKAFTFRKYDDGWRLDTR